MKGEVIYSIVLHLALTLFIGCRPIKSAHQADTNDTVIVSVKGITEKTKPILVLMDDMVGMSYDTTKVLGDVSAIFSFPLNEAPGFKDIIVQIPGPHVIGSWTFKNEFFLKARKRPPNIFFVNIARANEPEVTKSGLSWEFAFSNLQMGIDAAYSAGGGEVWVASGKYYPNSTDRSASFIMKTKIDLYGGFTGVETVITERDWIRNVTTLSGDIGSLSDSLDNCYHVISGADTSILDGFTIEGGNANGERMERLGGGMYNDSANTVINNCTFNNNYAEEGGAIYNINYSHPLITNSVFSGNRANNGGAIVCRYGSNAYLDSCFFNYNISEWRGGAIYIDYGARPAIVRCAFIENTTQGNGGAIYVKDMASQLNGTFPVIKDCTFNKNTARFNGGAVCVFDKMSNPVIYDCRFFSNSAGNTGGAIAGDYFAHLMVVNPFYDNNTVRGSTNNLTLTFGATSISY